MKPFTGGAMTTPNDNLATTKHPAALAPLDIDAIARCCNDVVATVLREGGPGTAKVFTTSRQFLQALVEHQQGHRRLDAEALRIDARGDSEQRSERLLNPAADSDGST
jgi:hypothetical protein